ncbi:MAG TPA: hypothetical protein VFG81_21015 [Anaerolineales bacterium]|nr:hypothetical protein [Anaerolineales bacterium]
MFELIILLLAALWFLSLFGRQSVPSMIYTAGFINSLSVLIVILIVIRFLW